MANASMERALKLAVVTGLRAALGPALVARSQHNPHQNNLALAAMAELVFDKLPLVPGRDTLPSLLARGLAGAWVASKCVEEEGENADPWAAPLGAAVAIGVGVAAPKIRRSLGWTTGMPQAVLGLIEDYLAIKLGSEAVGLSMHELSDTARESIDQVYEQLQANGHIPAQGAHQFQSAGAGSI